MRKSLSVFIAGLFCFNLANVRAQLGGGGGMGGPPGPRFDAAMAMLFGANNAFSATLELQSKTTTGGTVTMPGKVAFDAGKSRFELNMTEAKGGEMPPEAMAQIKNLGMDTSVIITRPDQKQAYLVYPGLKAYALIPIYKGAEVSGTNDLQMEMTELGKEKVDGHPCVKHKAVVTDLQGEKNESLVWNATDMKDFPVKIQDAKSSAETAMLFKDVKLSKPQPGVFDLPSGFKRYDSVQGLMQEEVIPRMGAAMGAPPRQ